MQNIELYNQISSRLSRDVTFTYSSSFSAATSLLSKNVADSICSIYGFVRIADEIVDSFRPKGMERQLEELREDLVRSVDTGFSANPIVYSFSRVIVDYDIQFDLINSFMASMQMDVSKKTYTTQEYEKYIYGSAEVVGLMCLMVFLNGDKKKYGELTKSAKALGSAFQKINFIRDFSSDSEMLGRLYFPNKDFKNFSDDDKKEIIEDIRQDLKLAKAGISKLPISSRYGVELAFGYFSKLTSRIAKTKAKDLRYTRVSLPRTTKLAIYISVRIRKFLRI